MFPIDPMTTQGPSRSAIEAENQGGGGTETSAFDGFAPPQIDIYERILKDLSSKKDKNLENILLALEEKEDIDEEPEEWYNEEETNFNNISGEQYLKIEEQKTERIKTLAYILSALNNF